ncbi:hypothetical protein PR048_026521 [Dryococelus australis]|uniref:Endonuclease/exonuclease/phosphatase domain-containing protein n=1 Tax=Dryococelus australis TaxID=614101 RepID=A0ABQ9GLK9_9NEOP|nr:hypothetical protein PR048_026521 [Dryococelus australis]
MAIKISIQGQNCIVMSVHAPPGKTITHENLVALNNITPTFFALGDLNAKYPSWNSVETPTRYPETANNQPDVLDITIKKHQFHLQIGSTAGAALRPPPSTHYIR